MGVTRIVSLPVELLLSSLTGITEQCNLSFMTFPEACITVLQLQKTESIIMYHTFVYKSWDNDHGH